MVRTSRTRLCSMWINDADHRSYYCGSNKPYKVVFENGEEHQCSEGKLRAELPPELADATSRTWKVESLIVEAFDGPRRHMLWRLEGDGDIELHELEQQSLTAHELHSPSVAIVTSGEGGSGL